jgi:glutathione synthase/RimK-type ligase-like ATP-grasp enzyme
MHPPRIALASCADYPEGAGGETLLAEALAERGAVADWIVWNDPDADWSERDLIVLRCTWDYPDHLEAFRAWVRSAPVATRLVNPPNLVLRNLHKGYLVDLGDLAVPTIVVPAGMTIDLGLLRWPQVVLKPAVGVRAIGAVRDAAQADLDALTLAPAGAVDAIVQPYLPRVESDGEVSVICVDGEPTHVVRKLPAEGDFRINEEWGGSAALAHSDPDDLDVARRALARLGTTPVYARVDLIHDGSRPRVIELELVEPYLWLELVPDVADRLAGVLFRRARHR